jgi:uncharacterized membrane protein YfcA
VVIAAAAALAAGALNALAGGGTLLLYPALVALGFPAITANLQCSIALCPGYLGAAVAQRQELRSQRTRLLMLTPFAVAGGLLGAWWLLRAGERTFEQAVPWLILLASVALGLQERLSRALLRRSAQSAAASPSRCRWPILLPVTLAAVYGGYFGAGVSVVLLAILGFAFADSFIRLNALKQALALAANAGAVLLFVVRAQVNWPVVALLAACAALGGYLGGRLATRVRPASLRRLVVVLGLALAGYYLARLRFGADL